MKFEANFPVLNRDLSVFSDLSKQSPRSGEEREHAGNVSTRMRRIIKKKRKIQVS